jgi:hypothetical protein
MLLVLAAILLLLWIGGFAFHVLGSLIHLVLVVAIIVAIVHFVTSRRAASTV